MKVKSLSRALNILFLWFFHGNMADLLLTVACYSKTLCLCLTLFLIFPWASGIFHYCCYGESALDILIDISWYKSASISLGCTLSLEFLGCRTMWTSHCTEKCFSSVQSLSCVWLFATPWIAAHQTSLSITNSKSHIAAWYQSRDLNSGIKISLAASHAATLPIDQKP